MADLLQSGPDDEGPEEERAALPTALRGLGLVALVLVAGVLLGQSGLLSADRADGGREAAGTRTPDQDQEGLQDRRDEAQDGGSSPVESPQVPTGPALVVRVFDSLGRIDTKVLTPGPRVPSDTTDLTPVALADGSDTLVGVAGARLLRTDPRSNGPILDLTSATGVVAPSILPGRVLVERDGAVVEVQVGTGEVTAKRPFPGAWAMEPVGVVRFGGVEGLVLDERVGNATTSELYLAWSAEDVAQGSSAEPVPLGSGAGQVLAVAQDWVVRGSQVCPGSGSAGGDLCPLSVLTVGKAGRVDEREVSPPDGWRFVPASAAGRARALLVPVTRADGSSGLAVVGGGDRALLVPGSEGVRLPAGLVTDRRGAVYFLVPAGNSESPGRVHVWRPSDPERAVPVPGTAAISASGELVCACR